MLRLVFFGATKFSEEQLLHLLINGYKIDAIFTIPEEFNISYSEEKVNNYNYAELNIIVKKYSINIYEVDSVSGKRITDYSEVIRRY